MRRGSNKPLSEWTEKELGDHIGHLALDPETEARILAMGEEGIAAMSDEELEAIIRGEARP